MSTVAARSRRLLSTLISDAAEPPEPNVESDLVVIIAALLCAIICLGGLAAVVRCACLRRTHSSTLPKSANKGLNKKILQSIPKFVLDPEIRTGFTAEECAICLAEFADGDEIRLLPQCGHGFHVGCVDTWLGAHSSCPSCRKILVAATRCQKCGHFPPKAREDSTAADASSAQC